MLTAETKKHIDSARQVLVGKVPDPKQQIDQITNALIYKFMDDMDVQAKDAGGKPSFFTGNLEKYAWRTLMDQRKGAQDRLNMYTEALEKFSAASQLPSLFRDIFRQAFLPYRDPETLNLFLKEIEFFDYSNSEELGNAFEYLLSIMGAQGDAGQFRTPRHIIDFMVDIIDPEKNDTILDPACGTAGFLISAYRHIVTKHEGKDASPLTHNEKQKLMSNLEGYDISSDMVKLARVNLYLHGNNQPKIYEYDSLTSQEHWGDSFDVMLANPPFMSPKGGIHPHDKFGVMSSRSEVLFVDYIMTHLKRNGRAGIIVPEGVIFQSGTAYRQLRKALIEDGLMAVVSLPAGVFNPYAGVKTSILIFDNNRAKLSKNIVFAKVEQDGFELGSQRRPMPDRDDLPIIASALKRYRLGRLKTQEQIDEYLADATAPQNKEAFIRKRIPEIQLVERTKIAESKDYNLSVSRYISLEVAQSHKWPTAKLGSLIKQDFGERVTKSRDQGTKYPVYGGGGQSFLTDTFNRQDELVISRFAMSDNCVRRVVGKFHLLDSGFTYHIREEFTQEALKAYVDHILLNIQDKIYACARGHAQKNIDNEQFNNINIPLPPLEVQERIVEELDSYQKIIDGARQVIENYKPTVDIDPVWPTIKLKELVRSLEAGVSVNSESRPAEKNEKGVLKTSAVTYGIFKPEENKVILISDLSRAKVSPRQDSIIISRMNTEQLVGASAYIDKDYNNLFLPDRLWQTVRARDDFSMKYLFYIISSSDFRKKLSAIAGGTSGSMKNISKAAMLELEIPLPPLKIQEKNIQIIEEMDVGVRATQKMLKVYEKKIKDKITEIWSG